MPSLSGSIDILANEDFNQLPEPRVPLSSDLNELIIPCLNGSLPKLLCVLYKLSLIELNEACYQQIISVCAQDPQQLSPETVRRFLSSLQSIQLQEKHRLRNLILVGNTFGAEQGNDFYVLFFIYHFFFCIDPSIQCKIIPGLNDYRFLHDLEKILQATFHDDQEQANTYASLISSRGPESTKNLAKVLLNIKMSNDTLLPILSSAVSTIQLAHYFDTDNGTLNIVTSANVTLADVLSLKSELTPILNLDECSYYIESTHNKIRYSLEDIESALSEQIGDEKIHCLNLEINREYEQYLKRDPSEKGGQGLILLRFAANLFETNHPRRDYKGLQFLHCCPGARSGYSLISPDGTPQIYYGHSKNDEDLDLIAENDDEKPLTVLTPINTVPPDFFKITPPPACGVPGLTQRYRFHLHTLSVKQAPPRITTEEEAVSLETIHVFGDMHGNFMKFLQFLMLKGIVQHDAALYQRFLTLYELSYASYSSAMMEDINREMQNIRFVFNGRKPSIILLGDLLRDRGRSDYLMIRLLLLLSKNCHLRIMLSNHDIEFLYSICLSEKELRKNPAKREDLDFILRHYQTPLAMENNSDTTRSFEAIVRLMQLNLIRHDDLITFIINCYLPACELFHFEEEGNHLTFFSHAPFDYQALLTLAETYHIPLSSSETPETYLTQLGNLQFRCKPDSFEKLLHYLDTIENERKAMVEGKYNNPTVLEPHYHFIWNRQLPSQEPHSPYHENTIILHGHNGPDSFYGNHHFSEKEQKIRHHYISLDNRYGYREEAGSLSLPVSHLSFQQTAFRHGTSVSAKALQTSSDNSPAITSYRALEKRETQGLALHGLHKQLKESNPSATANQTSTPTP